MNARIFQFRLLCLSLLLVAAVASGTAAAGNAPNGRELYNQNCVACHGADGKGTIPGAPAFTAKGSVLGIPDKLLVDRIMNGYQSPGSPMAMPPKGGNPSLTREDILAVLTYMRQAFGIHSK